MWGNLESFYVFGRGKFFTKERSDVKTIWSMQLRTAAGQNKVD